MSVKRAFIMAAAALAVVTGAGAAGTLTANAATPQCGAACTDIYSAAYGTAAHPNDLLAVTRSGGVGTPITLDIAGTNNPREDFEVFEPGTVSLAVQDGLIAAGMDALYGNLETYQIVYAPLGGLTNLCVGVGSTPAFATPVSLQECGVTAKTLWIAYSRTTTSGTYLELISGATTSDFADPYVLTTLVPGVQLLTARLTSAAFFLRHQLWGSYRPFVLS
jgi:hypothetical protein